jgi:hypothetical protein
VPGGEKAAAAGRLCFCEGGYKRSSENRPHKEMMVAESNVNRVARALEEPGFQEPEGRTGKGNAWASTAGAVA